MNEVGFHRTEVSLGQVKALPWEQFGTDFGQEFKENKRKIEVFPLDGGRKFRGGGRKSACGSDA